jgi:putative component of membrane protein insertase Oxa1/YidC/SpoIIIJ protein YidD
LEAFETRGFFVGFWLTLRRVLRCNPFCRPGYDPVPPKKEKNSPKRLPITERTEREQKEQRLEN